jgi:hypothetical protein
MEDQRISYKTGMLIKEKGFNWDTDEFFTSCKKHYRTSAPDYMSERNAWSNWNNGYGSYPTRAEEVDCSAPTQTMLSRWYREKHNIEVVAMRADDFPWYKYKISEITPEGKDVLLTGFEFKTNEDALEEGLLKAGSIIKNKTI